MKKLLLSSCLLLFTLFNQAQIVNIPDTNFKAALLAYSPAIDTNGDSQIQVSEAQALTTLDFLSLPYPASILMDNTHDLTGIEAFTNLTSLTLSHTSITSLDLSSITNLQTLNCSYNVSLLTLNLSGLTNLQNLNCSECYQLTALDLTGLVSLQIINCFMCDHISSLNLSVTPNLQSLNCGECQSLSSLDLTGLSHLTTLNCSGCWMNSLITTGANNLISLYCSSNDLTSLNVSGMTNLQTLDCSNQYGHAGGGGISVLDLTGLNLITSLNCSGNLLTSLDVSHLTGLTFLACSENNLTSLNVTPLTSLTSLSCGLNQIASLDVSNQSQLTYFDCSSNLLSALNIDNLTNLTDFNCSGNNISSLNVSNNTNITQLGCGSNHLTTLDITNLPNLTRFGCDGNQLTSMDFSNSHHLISASLGGNLFTDIDLSQAIIYDPNNPPYTDHLFNNSPNLRHINLKNGYADPYTSTVYVDDCPQLTYICADEDEIQWIQQSVDDDSINEPAIVVQVNSYCTFVPGGPYNTISGNVTLDGNNDGCDAGDIHPRDFKININDGTITGATFSNTNGNFSFYTQAGNFVLTPQFNNSYFNITPTTSNLNFPTVDGSTQTQNYCVTANGVHNDLDVVMFPNFSSAPGFDAHYILFYKNKGNQMLSGTVSVNFDDAVTDFVSAIPAVDIQSANNLVWNYTNLLPFESRTIYFTLNLNNPTETPPLNIGDVLHFQTTINPVAGDETPGDNSMNTSLTVVGSHDPNDKTCLEGNTITPEMVGDYLHYVIRFQNTGTYFAQNVVVRDEIDTSKFDVSTIELIGSSHSQTTRINGNKVEFLFENINLPAEADDEPGSHGFVAFKIKTKNNLVLGNSVQNTAGIYFDFNFPVITNTTSTTVAVLNVDEHDINNVSITPIPVKDILQIKALDNITSLELFDVQGRLLQSQLTDGLETSIDFTGKSNGVYLVKIYTSKGMKVKKVIKE